MLLMFGLGDLPLCFGNFSISANEMCPFFKDIIVLYDGFYEELPSIKHLLCRIHPKGVAASLPGA